MYLLCLEYVIVKYHGSIRHSVYVLRVAWLSGFAVQAVNDVSMLSSTLVRLERMACVKAQRKKKISVADIR